MPVRLVEITDVQHQILQQLLVQLTAWLIPRTNPPRPSVGAGRSITFGKVKKRFGGKEYKDSQAVVKKPLIWEILQQYGATLDIPWTSVQVNQQCVCAKHKDVRNVGDSYLVSLGDYVGGDLVVEGTAYNTSTVATIFNGSQMEHWNTDIQSGSKWSIVFFNTPH
jgi:hypothetical protein